MTLFLLAKVIHIITAIIFIGCVWFRTFIIPNLHKHIDKEQYKKVNSVMSKASRSFGVKNVLVLLVSGLYLFYSYFDTTNMLLHLKATIGVMIVITFYLAPFFVHKVTKKYPNFQHNFHLALFVLMMVLVVVSQLMFQR